jgi:hypothetical protein
LTPRRKKTRLPGLLALTALAAVLAGCSDSSGRPGPGPLGYPGNQPGNQSTLCMGDGHLGLAYTEGLDSFTNTGHDTLIIDRVTITSVSHMRLVGGYIVPGRSVVGSFHTFPPPAGQLSKGVQWARRRLPAGTRVRPGDWINVVVGLAPTATTGNAKVEVIYRDGDTRYERVSALRTIIKTPPLRCT